MSNPPDASPSKNYEKLSESGKDKPKVKQNQSIKFILIGLFSLLTGIFVYSFLFPSDVDVTQTQNVQLQKENKVLEGGQVNIIIPRELENQSLSIGKAGEESGRISGVLKGPVVVNITSLNGNETR